MGESIPAEELATNLAKLYDDYKQTIPKLESIPYAPPPPIITITKDAEPSLLPDTVPTEVSLLRTQTVVETSEGTPPSTVAREEYAMSRTQLKLTSEEGQFWSNLLHLFSTSAPLPTWTATPSANAEPEPEPDAELQTHLTL